MKFGEHEYKVMGMAPYASAPWRSGPPPPSARYSASKRAGPRAFAGAAGRALRALLEATLGLRFDAIAGGAQQMLEETLLRWARSCASATAASGWPWAAACS